MTSPWPPPSLQESARDGDLARTDARQPVPVRDRSGTSQEIYLRSAAGPLLSLLHRGADGPQPLGLRTVSQNGTPDARGRTFRRRLPARLSPRRNRVAPVLPVDRGRADRDRRDPQRGVSCADGPVRAPVPARGPVADRKSTR